MSDEQRRLTVDEMIQAARDLRRIERQPEADPAYVRLHHQLKPTFEHLARIPEAARTNSQQWQLEGMASVFGWQMTGIDDTERLDWVLEWINQASRADQGNWDRKYIDQQIQDEMTGRPGAVNAEPAVS